MKKIIELIIERLRIEIEVKKIFRGNLLRQEKILKLYGEILAEHEASLEEIIKLAKDITYKNQFFNLNEEYNKLEKESKEIIEEFKKSNIEQQKEIKKLNKIVEKYENNEKEQVNEIK